MVVKAKQIEVGRTHLSDAIKQSEREMRDGQKDAA